MMDIIINREELETFLNRRPTLTVIKSFFKSKAILQADEKVISEGVVSFKHSEYEDYIGIKELDTILEDLWNELKSRKNKKAQLILRIINQ